MARAAAFTALLLASVISARWSSEHLLSWPVRLTGTAVILVLTLALARTIRWQWLLAWLAEHLERRSNAVAWLAGSWCAIASAVLAFVVLEPFPHIEDEFAYLFQARVFAQGRLFAHVPPLHEFFPSPWVMTHESRWFAVFPPGWSAILSAGVALGLPALVNPLLGGASVLVMHALAREVRDGFHGAAVALLCCVSPFFLFMGASYMSHMALLLCLSISTLGHIKATTRTAGRGRMWWFLWSGLAAGAAVLIRPLDALAFWGAQALVALWTGRSRHLAGLTVSAGGLAAGALLYIGYNHVVTGTWLSTPLEMMSPAHRLGFGPDIGLNWATFDTPGHTPWRALINLNFNLAVMSQDLFGWPLSSLLFAILFVVFGRTRRDHALSMTIIAAFMAAYTLYWYHGVAFGARFYFCLLPHLLVLTVEGLRQLPEIVAQWTARLAPATRSAIGPAVVALSVLFGWLVYVPSIVGSTYENQRGINAGLEEFVARERIQSGIVFVRAPSPRLFGPGFIANQIPPLSGRIVFAFDRGDANQELRALLPEHPVYHYAYRPEAGRYQRLLQRLRSWAAG